jgi:DNA-binding MarR family transcriptional regulator
MKSRSDDLEAKRAVDECVRTLHRILQIVDLFSRKTFREFGVSGSLIWALRTIRDAECTTMSELAQRLHLHPSTVSGIVDRLEERGLALLNEACPDDRMTELQITKSGRNLISKAPEPPRSKIVRGIEGLSPEDRACVHRAIGILSQILDIAEPSGEAEQSK